MIAQPQPVCILATSLYVQKFASFLKSDRLIDKQVHILRVSKGKPVAIVQIMIANVRAKNYNQNKINNIA